MSFTVYRSSAGSGKTFTLVLEYLKLVLKWPDNYRHILALTFTNKAANEMKDRVLQYLDLLSGRFSEKDAARRRQLLVLLSEATGLSQETVASRSEDILFRIIHNFSDFSIATIDSFNHRIVRTFAYDLFLSSDFEIELEQSVLIDQAIDELMAQIGLNEELTRVLVYYSLSQSELDKNWNIEKALKEIAALLFNEEGRKQISALSGLSLSGFEEAGNRLKQFIREFEKRIREIGHEGVQLLAGQNLTPDDFIQKGSGPGKYFYHLRDFTEDKLQPNSHVRKARDDGKFLPSSASPVLKNTFDLIKDQFVTLLLKTRELLEADYPRFILYNAILANLNQLSVLTEIDRILSSVMKEQNRVHISEFNRRIENIVKQDSAPYIYVRLGDKYTSFLLDEFQDTSLLQWQNLLPLINNSLAENHFNLIVGDGKQAIYRWRSGEVEQFSSLPLVFEKPVEPQYVEYEQSLSRYYVEKSLGFNYRTTKNIVDFNNGFFEMAAKDLSESLSKVYLNQKQDVPQGQDGGYIRVDCFDKKNDGGLTFDEFNAERLLRAVHECLEDGFLLTDIVILTRTNKNSMEAARVLAENGFAVQSSESVLLNNAVVIKLLIACLRHLANPEDLISLTLIRRYITENDFPGNHWSVFTTRESGELSLLELVENIVRHFNLLQDNSTYLLRFFDVIHEFMNRKESSLLAFVEHWEEKKNSIFLVSSGQNAIRLMTIHKAKGLEFPVVIFSYANLALKTSKDLWISLKDDLVPELKVVLVRANKSLLETGYASVYQRETDRSTLDMLNMVYVAFTRPVYRLYIVTVKPPEKRSSDSLALPVLLDNYLASLPKSNTDDYFETGERTARPLETRTIPQNETALNSIFSDDWRTRLFIRQSAPENWNINNPDEKRRAGIVIHEVLSGIKGRSDLAAVLKNVNPEDLPELYTVETLTNQIRLILDHPVIGKYYDDGLQVFNECDILHPDGAISRPDRAVILDNELIVLDYKTGKDHEHHDEQMKAYIKTAREMGYRGLKAFLIYLNDEISVREVSL